MKFDEFLQETKKVICVHEHDSTEYKLTMIDFGISPNNALSSSYKEFNSNRERLLSETESIVPVDEETEKIVELRDKLESIPPITREVILESENVLAPIVLTYDGVLENTLPLESDFKFLYDVILNNVYKLANENPSEDALKVSFNKKIEEQNHDEYLKKLKSKLNNASNYIAINGRIGPAHYVVCNDSNKKNVDTIVESYSTDRRLNLIYDNNLPENNLILGRVNGLDQPNIVFIYNVVDGKVNYDIAIIGNEPKNQFVKIEF